MDNLITNECETESWCLKEVARQVSTGQQYQACESLSRLFTMSQIPVQRRFTTIVLLDMSKRRKGPSRKEMEPADVSQLLEKQLRVCSRLCKEVSTLKNRSVTSSHRRNAKQCLDIQWNSLLRPSELDTSVIRTVD